MYRKINIQSSYTKNNLGKNIYDAVIRLKPEKVIEFGSLNGYSAAAIAMGLRDNGLGHLYANDLWENYPFQSSTSKNCLDNIKKMNLEEYVTIGSLDFWEWLKNPTDFDLLHIDISNTGKVIEAAYDALQGYLDSGSVIIFEGGSEERDKVEWMIKYNKSPINPLKKKIGYKIINPNHPSISIIERV